MQDLRSRAGGKAGNTETHRSRHDQREDRTDPWLDKEWSRVAFSLHHPWYRHRGTY